MNLGAFSNEPETGRRTKSDSAPGTRSYRHPAHGARICPTTVVLMARPHLPLGGDGWGGGKMSGRWPRQRSEGQRLERLKSLASTGSAPLGGAGPAAVPAQLRSGPRFGPGQGGPACPLTLPRRPEKDRVAGKPCLLNVDRASCVFLLPDGRSRLKTEVPTARTGQEGPRRDGKGTQLRCPVHWHSAGRAHAPPCAVVPGGRCRE